MNKHAQTPSGARGPWDHSAATSGAAPTGTSIVQDVRDLFSASGFEVREGAGFCELVGSIDAGGVLVEAVLSDFGAPCIECTVAPAPTGWQPIETAPKDGTEVLLYLGAPWSCMAVARWFSEWSNWQEGEFPISGDEYCGIGSNVPTHWMPVPAPTARAVTSGTAPGDETRQESKACARTDVNVEEERAKFDVFMKPFEPRSQFRLREDGTYASKAMRERFDGWLCARSLGEAPLPKTGITVADITQLQRDLARHAAAGNVDVAATCVQAQAVIEGLLSGLDAGQLA